MTKRSRVQLIAIIFVFSNMIFVKVYAFSCIPHGNVTESFRNHDIIVKGRYISKDNMIYKLRIDEIFKFPISYKEKYLFVESRWAGLPIGVDIILYAYHNGAAVKGILGVSYSPCLRGGKLHKESELIANLPKVKNGKYMIFTGSVMAKKKYRKAKLFRNRQPSKDTYKVLFKIVNSINVSKNKYFKETFRNNDIVATYEACPKHEFNKNEKYLVYLRFSPRDRMYYIVCDRTILLDEIKMLRKLKENKAAGNI